MVSLNQIFFGPPGTGKTYATIEATLEILDSAFLSSHAGDRTQLKARFDELAASGHVHFVTFHQSFSYEDFVEGLRAESGDDGQLRYSVVPGVFKSLCNRPAKGYRAFKVGDQFGKSYRVKYASKDVVEIEKPKGKSLELGMLLLNGLADEVVAGRITAKDIQDKSWDAKLPGSPFDPFIVNGYQNLIPLMIDHMIAPDDGAPLEPARVAPVAMPKVLIIDEINRGNISRIFGDLITLIEPSKRAGADEALEVTLPYSKERFSVPADIFLIGTMNTADRSLAAMDIALRRRFTFVEVLPNPALLDQVEVEGIKIGELLRAMNARITALLDREHCLGHAYFMPLKESPTLDHLERIFRQQVLPLLQEYFFEDWQRIHWVLNDHRKAAKHQFLRKTAQNVDQLFGDAAVKLQDSERWDLNSDAFKRIEAYQGVIDVVQTTAIPSAVAEAGELAQ